MKHRKLTRPIGNFTKVTATKQEPEFTPPMIAKLAMQAERSLTPRILETKLPPDGALVVIAMHTHSLMAGQGVWLSEQRIAYWCSYVLSCWKYGLFTPSKAFPYSFEQMFEASDGQLVDLRQFAKPGVSFDEASHTWKRREPQVI